MSPPIENICIYPYIPFQKKEVTGKNHLSFHKELDYNLYRISQFEWGIRLYEEGEDKKDGEDSDRLNSTY